MTTSQIRNAVPEDAESFCELVWYASGELLPFFFGAMWRQILQYVFQQPGNLGSYDKTYVLTMDDRPAGMILGYSWQQQCKEKSVTDRIYMKQLKLRALWVGFNYMVCAPRWFGKAEKDEFYLQDLALYPEFRGMGGGTILIEHMEVLARNSGCHMMSLDVEVPNKGAIALYQRLGYEIADEARVSRISNKAGRVYRMRKNLENKGRDVSFPVS